MSEQERNNSDIEASVVEAKSVEFRDWLTDNHVHGLVLAVVHKPNGDEHLLFNGNTNNDQLMWLITQLLMNIDPTSEEVDN